MSVPDGDWVDVQATWDGDAGELELVLDNEQIVSGGWGSDGASATDFNDTGASEDLVFAVAGAANAYELSVRVMPCLPSDREDPEAPGWLAEGTRVNQHDRRLCAGEVQYYSFDVPAGEKLTAQISFEHAAGDLSLTVIDPNAQETTSNGTTDVERVSVVNAEASTQTFLLRVEGDAMLHSSFTTQIWSGDPACSPSMNDSQAEALELTWDAAVQGQLCADESDYFSVRVPASSELTLELSYPKAGGEVRFDFLCGDDCDHVSGAGGSGPGGDTETVAAYVTNGGSEELLQVFRLTGVANDYEVVARGGE